MLELDRGVGEHDHGAFEQRDALVATGLEPYARHRGRTRHHHDHGHGWRRPADGHRWTRPYPRPRRRRHARRRTRSRPSVGRCRPRSARWRRWRRRARRWSGHRSGRSGERRSSRPCGTDLAPGCLRRAAAAGAAKRDSRRLHLRPHVAGNRTTVVTPALRTRSPPAIATTHDRSPAPSASAPRHLGRDAEPR